MNKRSKVAGIYCRLSKPGEANEVKLDDQERRCREKAKALGWTVGKVYVEDSISAWDRTKVRPKWKKLLEDISAGTITAVIALDADRLVRQPIELEQFFNVCDDAGMTDMATVQGTIDLGDPTGSGKLVARLLGSVAAAESDQKRERLRRRFESLAKEGKLKGGGPRPFGYEKDRVTVRPDESALIQEAARRILNGGTLRAICRDWNEAGYRTTTGKAWNNTTLRNVLRSARIAGLCEHKRKVRRPDGKQETVVVGVYPAEWPAIVNQRTHEQLRLVFDDPSRRRGKDAYRYLLTGFLFCGECEGTMYSRTRGRDRKRSYTCLGGTNFKGCGKVSVEAASLEAYVAEVVYLNLSYLEENGHSQTTSDDVAAEQDDALAEIADLQSRLEALATDRYVEQAITDGEFQTARVGLLKKIDTLKEQLLPVPKALDFRELLESAQEWNDGLHERAGEFDHWRGLISASVERIEVGRGVVGRNFFDKDRIKFVWR